MGEEIGWGLAAAVPDSESGGGVPPQEGTLSHSRRTESFGMGGLPRRNPHARLCLIKVVHGQPPTPF